MESFKLDLIMQKDSISLTGYLLVSNCATNMLNEISALTFVTALLWVH